MTPVPGPNPDHRGGFVYFARLPGLPEIKIGCSGHLRSRLPEIQRKGVSRCAYPLLIVAGGNSTEARFHAAFEPHHIGNEWFEPAPEILEAIIAIHAGVFDWDALPDFGWSVTKPFQTRASLAHWGPLPRFAAPESAAA